MGKATLGASTSIKSIDVKSVAKVVMEEHKEVLSRLEDAAPIEIIKEVIKEVRVEVPVEVVREVEVIREVRVEVPVEVIVEKPVIVTEIRQVPVEVIREVEKVIRVEDMGKLKDLNREIRKLKEDKKLLKILLGMAVVVAIIAGVS